MRRWYAPQPASRQESPASRLPQPATRQRHPVGDANAPATRQRSPRAAPRECAVSPQPRDRMHVQWAIARLPVSRSYCRPRRVRPLRLAFFRRPPNSPCPCLKPQWKRTQRSTVQEANGSLTASGGIYPTERAQNTRETGRSFLFYQTGKVRNSCCFFVDIAPPIRSIQGILVDPVLTGPGDPNVQVWADLDSYFDFTCIFFVAS